MACARAARKSSGRDSRDSAACPARKRATPGARPEGSAGETIRDQDRTAEISDTIGEGGGANRSSPTTTLRARYA